VRRWRGSCDASVASSGAKRSREALPDAEKVSPLEPAALGRDDDMSSFPTQARVVIVGGGIMGCSTAYHLAKLGWKDVVLLEQGRLSGGTTWHAAGLVGQLRSYQNLTRLIRYSTELYSKLEAETGRATGWKQRGSHSRTGTQHWIRTSHRSPPPPNSQGFAR